MLKARWARLLECLCRKPSLVLILLPCGFLASLYVVTSDDYEFDVQYPSFKSYNVVEGMVDGYLVWNPRCHMLAKDPLDPSIVKFVKKEKFDSCNSGHLFTQTCREPNGTVTLYVDPATLAIHPDLDCCWSAVARPKFTSKPTKDNFDSTIVVKTCESFKHQANMPEDVEVAFVSCKSRPKKKKEKPKTLYENVHAILNMEKVRDRFEYNASQPEASGRKLSILMLGIDSVSRLNFLRTMPKTEKYLRSTGWVGFKGYNKMGDNTFPNLMAILTGQNQQQAYSICKPTVAYKLDRCPFLWHNFRNAGYATAYGEDETELNTFNYLKLGFVDPPTDYYLRPFLLASEKLLKVKKRYGLKYCTGPEISFERVFDYAGNFARTFLGLPYFGFFWSTTVSHDNMNVLSSMDGRVLQKLRHLERDGVLNDTMVVFLSDHGMRWGPIRNTFVGWYEERLPFIYFWLPEWFRRENPEAYESLSINQNRLTSPFDVYETLREVVRISGGDAPASPACATCQSLFTPVPRERGCADAGVAPHWCACTLFKSLGIGDELAMIGVNKFLEHVESIVKGYRDKKGRRYCAMLRLKKVHRIGSAVNFANTTSTAYFYMIQTAPGDGKFEFTARYYGNGNYTISDDEVSRINAYSSTAKCLNHGMKQYCHCLR